jgi:tetratricopeptide (TPR) repeat protein
MSGPQTNVPNFPALLARLSASQQWDRVRDYAGEWLAAEPENVRAHQAAAQAAIQLKQYAKARPHINRVLQREPDNDFAHRLLSIIQFHAGEFAAADQSIHKAISLDPNDAYNWYHLGWMCYKQGTRALPEARRCLEKARELAPHDPNIINLLALCEPETPEAARRKFQQYLQALELDPGNSDVHNNLGVHYLNVESNYTLAEECFRRSLALNPSSALARQNLFITLKKSDRVYRVLHLPRDLLARAIGLVGKSRRKNLWLFLLVLPLWILSARFVMGGLALWFLFVWPLVKVYEHLTIGDIRAQAGEIGAKKGGFLGYRRWPFKARLGIFAAILTAFWGGTAYACWRWPEERNILLGFAIGIIVIVLVGRGLILAARNSRAEAQARKRAKVASSLLSPNVKKKSWWNFFGKKPVTHE